LSELPLSEVDEAGINALPEAEDYKQLLLADCDSEEVLPL